MRRFSLEEMNVPSPSLKDFVRYQLSSEMSLPMKVLPCLGPFSADSTVVLLNRNASCRLCSRWDSCRKLLCAHLGVASCRAFLYLSGAENSHTQELAQLETEHPVLLTLVPHHLLGSKTLSLRDVVKSCDTTEAAWSNQLCATPALHPTEIPHSLPAERLDVCLGDMQQ